MGISDAKNPEDWQLGFEDGVRFALNGLNLLRTSLQYDLEFMNKSLAPCNHDWSILANMQEMFCHKCGIKKLTESQKECRHHTWVFTTKFGEKECFDCNFKTKLTKEDREHIDKLAGNDNVPLC